MANSPGKNSDRILSYTVYSNGKNVGDMFRLSYVFVRVGLNRIGRANLKFDAGDITTQTFDELDSDMFKPGASIQLDVGDVDAEKTLFVGTVVTLNVQLEAGSRGQMVVECRDCAFAATMGRKNRIFEKKKDSEIISEVLSDYGAVEVDATTYKHSALVQYYSTDWDFALSRADACGLLVNVLNGKISVKKPKVDAAAVLTVTYGVDMIDFNGGLSASEQFTEVEAVSWNLKDQAVVSVKSATPSLNDQGNIPLSKLKGGDKMLFQTDAPVESDALQAWVNSQALKIGLARFRGSFTFVGNASAIPGCVIELAGMGERLNGNVYVGAVEHIVRDNVWVTRVEMGIPPENITGEADVKAPAAAGLLPGIGGLHVGKVEKLNEDPGKEQRILVSIPLLNGDKTTVWARLATLYAANGRGTFFIPEKGDEVVVGFVNEDPGHPVILGSMYSSAMIPSYELTAENYKKAIVTKEKMKVEFDEEKKIITVTTPGNNMIELNDDAKSVKLKDQNGNELLLDKNGILLSSAKDIVLKAKSNITVEATSKIALSAKTDVQIEGLNVKAEAKTGFTAKGNATAELSASGQTTVKGGMVMIN